MIGVAGVVLFSLALSPAARVHGADDSGGVFYAVNPSGGARTINVAGFPVVARNNPFFQELGVNGRRCVTCHRPANNMTVTPTHIQARFWATRGTAPIFRPHDGANSPLADVSTPGARRAAYSMLLTKAVIRIGLSVPETAEFELVDVFDPYGYAGRNANGNELSLFRRPLPATNLAFLSTVMWDGRETIEKGSAAAMRFDLIEQANTATLTHAQATGSLDQATLEAIVAYEMGLYTAQVFDRAAGRLDAKGARGGPRPLSTEPFVFGMNDFFGCDPMGENCTGSNPLFNPFVFTEFEAWARLPNQGRDGARAAVARGQAIFNTRPIFGVTSGPVTCSSCHSTPHAGSRPVPLLINLGVADPPVSPADGGDGVHNQFGLPVGDMPIYTLRNKTTHELVIVTDPGQGLVSGKWIDVGSFKIPNLRGLAGRAPYFHNGAAAQLSDVVNFYDTRFGLALTELEKSDLVAFLATL